MNVDEIQLSDDEVELNVDEVGSEVANNLPSFPSLSQDLAQWYCRRTVSTDNMDSFKKSWK